jgi:hypothetical protein
MTEDSAEGRINNKFGIALAIAILVVSIWFQSNIGIEYKIGSTLIAAFAYFMLIINEKLNIIMDKINKIK